MRAMHRRLLVPAAALTALALSATPAAAKTIAVTEAADGTTVVARAGDTIRIALASNPTTGYDWAITRRPARAVAILRSARYVPPAASMPGAGGVQRYVLRARGAGTTRFAARYAQAGSGDVGQTFSIQLRVRTRLS